MELTQANMMKVYKSKEVKSLVNAFLLQKTIVDVTREEVNSVYAEILQKIEIFTDAFPESKRHKLERIFDHDKMYLSKDEDAAAKIYDEADRILKQRGIKPESMEHDYCPALVAEEKLRKIEHALIDATGRNFGVTVTKLLSGINGLKNYDNWIDLSVKAVVNMPGFVNPLTGKKL
jgi:hypothetical protein